MISLESTISTRMAPWQAKQCSPMPMRSQSSPKSLWQQVAQQPERCRLRPWQQASSLVSLSLWMFTLWQRILTNLEKEPSRNSLKRSERWPSSCIKDWWSSISSGRSCSAQNPPPSPTPPRSPSPAQTPLRPPLPLRLPLASPPAPPPLQTPMLSVTHKIIHSATCRDVQFITVLYVNIKTKIKTNIMHNIYSTNILIFYSTCSLVLYGTV